MLDWYDAVDVVNAHIFQVSTPDGTGTGFLLSRSEQSEVCAVATAGHVVRHADTWQQLIRLRHHETSTEALLAESQRAIFSDPEVDTAAIAFERGPIQLAQPPLQLIAKGDILRIGSEIGWVGFPAISPRTLCFFSGRISAYTPGGLAYLVDGVAINGVSGGPAFIPSLAESVTIIGVVTAYVPNTATGETLPGLCLVSNVIHLQAAVETFDNLDKPPNLEPPSSSTSESDDSKAAPNNSLEPTRTAGEDGN